MKTIIKSLIDHVIDIEAVGHHHLKRHQVYKVTSKERILIIKFYFKKNRFQSELNALLVLQGRLPVPKIVDYGTHEEVEYLILSYLEGQPLDQIDLSEAERNHIMEEAGRYLRCINTTPIDEPYGRYNKKRNFSHYQDYLDNEINMIIEYLKDHQHPQPDIIKQGVELLLNKRMIPRPEKALCHLDFSGRNIMVDRKDGKAYISGIIDFEQTCISDLARELALVNTKLLDEKTFAAFYKGYNRLVEVPDMYYLFYGLAICSWSLPLDRDFYNEGLDLVKSYI